MNRGDAAQESSTADLRPGLVHRSRHRRWRRPVGGDRRAVAAIGRTGRPLERRTTCTSCHTITARDERGITTAEYAVGTAAGAGLAGLLYKLLTGGFGDQLLRTLFDHVLGLLGIG